MRRVSCPPPPPPSPIDPRREEVLSSRVPESPASRRACAQGRVLRTLTRHLLSIPVVTARGGKPACSTTQTERDGRVAPGVDARSRAGPSGTVLQGAGLMGQRGGRRSGRQFPQAQPGQRDPGWGDAETHADTAGPALSRQHERRRLNSGPFSHRPRLGPSESVMSESRCWLSAPSSVCGVAPNPKQGFLPSVSEGPGSPVCL